MERWRRGQRSPVGFQVTLELPSLSIEWSEICTPTAHSGQQPHSYLCPDGVLIQVSRLEVSGIPAPPQRVSVTPYSLIPEILQVTSCCSEVGRGRPVEAWDQASFGPG